MEAVPKLPMLSFELKSNPQKTAQFGPDLTNLIRQYYQEDPNNYANEIQALDKLRTQAMKPSKDLEGCALLKRYMCQLYFLLKRFPMLKDGPPSADSSWKDLFPVSSSRKVVDYRVEWTVTLFNIGALHTQLGASDDRTTPEGLKLSCTHFQCAAWAFQYLQEVNSMVPRSDFDPGFFQFLIPTCLAQAQECIVEKSMTDNRKPCISAKVASQICEYYGMAMNALTHGKTEELPIFDVTVKNSHIWISYVKYKRAYYECIANLFLGMQAEEDEKMGERVAYFELAAEKLQTAVRYAKYVESPQLYRDLDEALTFTRDVVEGKRKNAVNENEFIYHEEVPPKDSLPKVKGAVLVKCIGFEFSDPEISGQDIFSKLISLNVHKLSSVYSEEKAKLLRSVSSSVEEKEAELISFMQSFKLDYLNPCDDPDLLPEELIERCAACEAKPDLVQDLIDSMNKLADAHREVETMMKEILELIEEEEKAEDEYQIIMGTLRPSIVTTDLKCESSRYLEALKKATESNESLNNAISAHVNNLRVLSLPLNELQKQLPSVSFSYSVDEETIVKELKRLVDKVEEMKNQRASLMLQLRDSLRNDDITDQLALTDEDKNAFSVMVVKEISKHQNVVNLIEQNLKAQSNILKAVTNSYASYAPIRKIISETAQRRALLINALIESFDVSDDVLKKASKGLEFYRKLEANVKKLLSRVRGTCKVQEEERTQMYLKAGKSLPKKEEPVSVVAKGSSSTAERSTYTPKLKDYIMHKHINKIGGEAALPYNPYYSVSSSSYTPVTIPPAFGRIPSHVGQYTIPAPTVASVGGVNQYNAIPPQVGPKPVVAESSSNKPVTLRTSTTTLNQYYPVSQQVGVKPMAEPSRTLQQQPIHTPATAYATPYASYGRAYQNVDPAVAYNQTMTASTTPYVVAAAYPSNEPYAFQNNRTVNGYATTYAVPSADGYVQVNASTNYQQPPASTPQNLYANYTQNNATYVDGTALSPMPLSANTNVVQNGLQNVYTTLPQQSVNVSQASIDGTAIPTAVNNYVAVAAGTRTVENYGNSNNTVGGSYANYFNGGTVAGGHSNVNYNVAGAVNYSYDAMSQMQYHKGNGGVVYTPPTPMLQQQHNISHTDTQNITEPSTDFNYVSVSSSTYSSMSRYTSAGHHNTTNIESSSKNFDGQSYAVQYATSSNAGTPTDGGTQPSFVDGDVVATTSNGQQYYTSQYGYHHHTAANAVPNVYANVATPHAFTDGNNVVGVTPVTPNGATMMPLTKRNSMTYMQAGVMRNNNVVSACTKSNSSSTEDKNESNVDLLGDLDFSVTDAPLVPVSLKPTAATNDDKIADDNVVVSHSNEPSKS